MVVRALAGENEWPADAQHRPSLRGPAAVRYPRGTGPGVAIQPNLDTLPIGKAEVRCSGARIALLAFGAIMPAAEQVGDELGLTVVNMRFVRPLDRALILELARATTTSSRWKTTWSQAVPGAGVAELLAEANVQMSIQHLGLPDAFQHHASREDLLTEAGLDIDGIRCVER